MLWFLVYIKAPSLGNLPYHYGYVGSVLGACFTFRCWARDFRFWGWVWMCGRGVGLARGSGWCGAGWVVVVFQVSCKLQQQHGMKACD